ncbi:hypothetical protein [Mesorhizobium silamurunense]|uniref:hypothetical protein n=1 Tax=Mesorhizobium silamurunense TaxID=499528 RepID=UPI00177E6C72|nr:hypothetical protein [Mesorhizobium silamurunense]
MAKAKSPKVAAGPTDAKPILLSGGNPQIAKGYGDAPVQAYLHIHEDDRLDEAQFVSWVKQASQLPGERT